MDKHNEINFNIDKTKFKEVTRISEAIETGDMELAREAISSLIKKEAVVQLRFKYQLVKCDSHEWYFPGQCNKFQKQVVYFAINCQYNHRYCFECLEIYLKECFNYYYLNNMYPCICCYSWNVEGSLLLYDNDLLEYLVLIYGQIAISEIANFPYRRNDFQINSELPVICQNEHNSCDICHENNSELYIICLNGHNSCKSCIQRWLQVSKEIKCLLNDCEESLNAKVIISVLKESQELIKFKEKFREKGIFLNFCPNCKKIINLEKQKTTTFCLCGIRICNNCERKEHTETCFYYESQNEFEVIDLAPPIDLGNPQNLREQEYLNAKYAFNNFIGSVGSRSFKSARLIVNKPLERRYFQKKTKMSTECGGISNVGEIYIWHGSKYANYDSMMREGLKVGGVDIPIACGTACGYGVYSAITPDTPISYARDSKWILGCLAMKGNNSKVPINNIALLDKGDIHSYDKGNWKIFFTKEQILPRFLVEYS